MKKGPGTEEAEVVMVVAPDGGYGWIIVLVCFLVNLFFMGISYSFYLYKDHISKLTGVTETTSTAINSVFICFQLCMCPIFSAVSNLIGFRTILIGGCILAATSAITTYFATNIVMFFVFFGGLGGIGTSMIFIASSLPACFWFDRKRPIAIALVSSGVGFGFVVIPYSTIYLMNSTGNWKNGYLYQAAWYILGVVLGLFLRPVPSVRVELEGQNWSHTVSASHMTVASSTRHEMQTVADVVGQSRYRINEAKKKADTPAMRPGLARPTQASLARITDKCYSPCCECQCCEQCSHKEESRQLYRDDLYYYGSVYRLEKKAKGVKTDDKISYAMSVSRLPTKKDMEESGKCVCCPEAFRRVLKSLFDLSLFRSCTFILSISHCAFASTSSYLFFFFITETYKDYQPKEVRDFFVTVAGAGDIIGRISSGILLYFVPNLSALGLNMILLAVVLLVCSGSIFIQATLYLYVYCFLFGAVAGAGSPLRSLINVDYLTLSNLTPVTGISLFVSGVLGPLLVPLGNFLSEQTIFAPLYMNVCCISLCIATLLGMAISGKINEEKE